jgi:phage baseplate assembly protein W
MPFSLTPSGSVAVTTDPGVQARQHVTSLVSTQPGERVMNPAYGVSLAALVFAGNVPAVVATIQRDVTQALARWEPSIQVNSVTPVAGTDPTQGVAMVNVDFQAGAQAGAPGAGIQTATIEVGGRVVNDTGS